MTEADREKARWIRNGLVYAGAEDLCRIIRELEAERDALRARCERLEKALRNQAEKVMVLTARCDAEWSGDLSRHNRIYEKLDQWAARAALKEEKS